MLKEYINKPYIIFPFGSPKLALVITIAYLIVFVCFFLYDRKTKHLKIKIRWIHKMPQREKNKTIIFLIGFVCLVAFSIILPFFFAEDNLILTISKIYLEYEALPFLAVLLFLCSAFFNRVNKDRQIEDEHQKCPADAPFEEKVRDGCKTANAARRKAVTVLEEEVSRADNNAGNHCV